MFTEKYNSMPMSENLKRWQCELRSDADKAKIGVLSSFFKTGKGEYGEGDIFIGLSVPKNRAVSKKYSEIPLDDIAVMLSSPIHEFRLAALLALVERQRKLRTDCAGRKIIVDFYLAHTAFINNWDLVDLSAPTIIGDYMADIGSADIAFSLVNSKSMWEQRIAIVSTLALIRRGDFAATLRIAEDLLSHPHDLIHKSTGWMLREVGKRDEAVLRVFLDKHCTSMPRTALRYAIERLDNEIRRYYMTLKR